MKVTIREGICTGHGRCYSLFPGLFEDDEFGFGRVRGSGEVDPGLEAVAREVPRRCPEGAIVLSE